MNDSLVTTAVIPVAGLGTRMAPFTAGVPKFMAPISEGNRSRPNIDYTLDDCLAAGITKLIFITSNGGDEQLKKYLGPIEPDVEARYRSLGKIKDLELEIARRGVYTDLEIIYVDQPVGKYGTAIPLCLAKDALAGEKYFAVTGGDDFIWHADGTSELALAIESWQASNAEHGIMGKSVAREEASKYGILQLDDRGIVVSIDEKPALDRVPEQPLANISRYILNGDLIWPILDEQLALERPAEQPEYYITDVINAAAAAGQRFKAHQVHGAYLDAGSPRGITQASIFITEQLSTH